MKHSVLMLLLAAVVLAQTPAQQPQTQPQKQPTLEQPTQPRQQTGAGWQGVGGPNPTLPNGKSQRSEITRVDHENNLRDAAELVRLATDINSELQKSGAGVLSLKTLKNVERAEKLSKEIRQRLKRNL